MEYVPLLMLWALSSIHAEEITLQKATGDVYVRHGVTEVWTEVAPGDVLKPDDTMKTGEKGSAVLLVDGKKRIHLPGKVIVDVSDIRTLSQEELMLKLTMEKVRSSSYRWKSDEMNIPNAAVMHGFPPTKSALTENNPEVGSFEWNGTKVLYDNGYYSTSALKAMDILRRYPPLAEQFENRLLIADALERAHLQREALNEYVSISQSDQLTDEHRQIIRSRIEKLRQQSRQ
jgi:hypothetical protein